MLRVFMDHYIMLAELLGLWAMIDTGVHVKPRTARYTRYVIVTIFVEAILWSLERWTQSFETLSLARPLLTATIYLLHPIILILIMEMPAPSDKRRWPVLLPLLISIPILYTSQWTHAIFWYTKDNLYQGVNEIISLYPYALFLFYMAVFVIRYFKLYYKYNGRIRSGLVYIIIASVVGVALHIVLMEDTDYSTLFATFVIMFYLFLYMLTSKTDTLTGLMNRQCYYYDSKRYFNKISAVVSVDMNDLKWLNDNNGHEAGDLALKTVANCLDNGFARKNIYRIGGDEYAIFYFGVDEEHVRTDIEDMRERLAKTDYVCAFGYKMVGGEEDFKEAMREADKYMYKNKTHLKDSDEKRMVAHREAMINVMHEALKSGMWGMEFDEEGKMSSVEWSEQFRKMIGFKDESDFPNKLESWSDRLHPDDKDRVLREYNETIADYTDKKTYDVEYRFMIKSGEWRWFHAMGRLLRRENGVPLSYVGMFVDITDAKDDEARLHDALKRAEQANLAKTTFLSNMSHDIRTPINGIMGMTTIALGHLDDCARVKECLESIDGSSHHLLSLVNDVLDLSRIEAGKIHVNHDSFDIRSLMENCISIIKGQLNGKNLSVDVDYSELEHPNVMGDELHLRQIIINILGNSVKFTDPGGKITLKAKELSSTDDDVKVRFVLADNGIGMSEEFIPKLFEAFSQEKTSARTSYQGTGLGMAITKQFVDIMGGEISVESKLGEGTSFTLDFTFEKDETGDANTEIHGADASYDISGMKVLVAEDVDLNMIIVTTLLEENGAIVTEATDGMEAVEHFEESEPGFFDAILMDIMMPRMNGLEATKTIRGLERSDAKTVPIIATTANAFEEDVKKAIEAGMNSHIAKPIEVDVLLRTLSGYNRKKN